MHDKGKIPEGIAKDVLTLSTSGDGGLRLSIGSQAEYCQGTIHGGWIIRTVLKVSDSSWI